MELILEEENNNQLCFSVIKQPTLFTTRTQGSICGRAQMKQSKLLN